MRYFLQWLLIFSTLILMGQGPVKLAEVTHGGPAFQIVGETPSNYVRSDGVYFFNGMQSESGRELWRSDGTADGTYLLKDIRPGEQGSEPGKLTPTDDGRVFFLASVGLDQELYVTDGTAAGTRLVKDINTETTATFSSVPMTYWKGMLYFSGKHPDLGNVLWRSDGTEAGTAVLKDLEATREGTRIDRLVPFGDYLYFYASGDEGLGLYRTDGTVEGTINIFDNVVFDDGGSAFKGLVAGSNYLYFTAVFKDDEGAGLYRSDGTEAGTTLLWSPEDRRVGSVLRMNIFTGAQGAPTTLDNRLLFATRIGRGFDAPYGLYAIDTESSETILLKEFDEMPEYATLVGDQIFFYGKLEETGTELWVTDGTEAGTVMPREVIEGTDGLVRNRPEVMGTYEGFVYFRGRDPASNQNLILWKSDGTKDNTVPVATTTMDGISSPQNFSNGLDVMLYTSLAASDGRRNLYCFGCKADDPPNSIFSAQLVDQVAIYPNPISRERPVITITNNGSAIRQLTLLDAFGRMVTRREPSGPGVDFHLGIDLLPGVYYLHVTMDGGKLGVGKFVVR